MQNQHINVIKIDLKIKLEMERHIKPYTRITKLTKQEGKIILNV